MKRLIGLAAAVLMVPAFGATMATTASASSAMPAIATPGTLWTVTTPHLGCENVKFLAHHKFIADQFGDAGTFSEPTHATIKMTWTTGADDGTFFKGTFHSGTGHYTGHINFGSGSQSSAMLIPGDHSGC